LEKRILLTFDLEEFDLPLEFGCQISEADQISVTNTGLQRLIRLLAKYNITATFFTTAFYADKNKELIKSLSSAHEIASHSNCHSDFKASDPSDSKISIERITGKQIYGFRMPRFQKINMECIKAAGYRYDSSVNPTFIPGRYNNFFTNRKLYLDIRNNLTELPVSVSPLIRFPLFWLSFKNIPLPMYLRMCKMAIRKDSYLHLCFHPWEFGDLEHFNIPWYIKHLSGEPFSEKFEKLVVRLSKIADFSTISGFLDSLEVQ
jgi:peptidoglycan/xylan/chitin deacetylase (PgdA/CDA1 family)